MRLVHCLRFELETPPPASHALLVWLNADGNAQPQHARSMDRNKRIVDLVPGDGLWHRGTVYRIRSVEPYRWHTVTEVFPQAEQSPRDGFLME
jgi:hypothetical protein